MAGNKPPLVSICVPAYNHEKYVAECIEAAVKQTYPNIELLIIDDGSTDTTWKILASLKKKCEKRFKRVVFETQQNQGTCITFSKLFKKAKGEYIILCASDDKLLPTTVEKLSSYLLKHDDIGLVLGKNLIMDSQGKKCYWTKKRGNVYAEKDAFYKSFTEQVERSSKVKTTSVEYGTYASLVKCNHIANGWMFRKSLLEKIAPLSKEAPLEDWWFMLQISKAAKIKAINEPTFYYRWHGANTASHSEKMQKMFLKTLLAEEKLLQKLGDMNHLQLLKQAWYYKKTIFNLGFLKLYKDITPEKKQKILEIFGCKIVLKTKK